MRPIHYIMIGGLAAILMMLVAFPGLLNDIHNFNYEPVNVIFHLNENKATLVIDNGNGNPRTFEHKFNGTITAFDLLKAGLKNFNLGLITQDYGSGIFIESIGDDKNGENNKYWLYYVNQEMPTIAADKKEIKNSDIVEFRFEKSPF